MQDQPQTPEQPQPVSAGAILGHVEIRKAAACRAFWSDHPLNLAYREKTGSAIFSLAQFVEFVCDMSADEFGACMFSAGVLR